MWTNEDKARAFHGQRCRDRAKLNAAWAIEHDYRVDLLIESHFVVSYLVRAQSPDHAAERAYNTANHEGFRNYRLHNIVSLGSR